MDVLGMSFIGVFSALVYLLIGLLVFLVAFKMVSYLVLTAWREEIIEQQNTALALLLGLLSLSAAIIIAAAVH